MNRNAILLGIIVLALVGLGIFAWVTFGDTSATDQPLAALDSGPALPPDYDRSLGDPKAPIKMIEYAAPMCPICAAFDMREFPKLKAEYIDTGKVFYTYRVFPIGNPDFAAEGIARCLPKEQYLPFIDTLYRNQDKWDPDGHQIPDIAAALRQMAAVAGLSADQADRCMQDKITQERTSRIQQEASVHYGVSGTPTFIIEDKVAFVGEWPWEQMKATLDAKLTK